MDARELHLKQWLAQKLPVTDTVEAQKFDEHFTLSILCGDASMRRYFRCISVNSSVGSDVCSEVSKASPQSWIAVDTPIDCSNFLGFTSIAKQWADLQIPVPRLIAEDNVNGFMLLEDLGDDTLFSRLTTDNADSYYQLAIGHLIDIQQTSSPEDYPLPPYDLAMLNREMGLFDEWLLTELLGVSLDENAQQLLKKTYDILAQSALQQPKVTVHRDYHSRNLMITDNDKLAIIDFQDAVTGPVTYDIVSLLKDCYVQWPEQQRKQWLDVYINQAVAAGIVDQSDADNIPKWFDFMGAQRHLKAAGIFARLKVRDGKSGYLADIPRTLGYIAEFDAYPELEPFVNWLKTDLVPRMKASDYFSEKDWAGTSFT